MRRKESEKSSTPNGQINRFVNALASLVLLMASITLCLAGAEIYARIYDRYADFPVFPKKEKRDDDGITSRIAGTEVEKAPGVKRILVLGDSIAYGEAIKKDETFSKRLEIFLNDNKTNERYEIINTGYPGFDTTQELSILLDGVPFGSRMQQFVKIGFVGFAYKPDIILLEYTVENDALWINPELPFETIYPHRWPSDKSRRWNYGDYALPVPEMADRWLGKHSYFYHFFLNKYDGLLNMLGLRDHAGRIRKMFKPDFPGWQRSKSALYGISEAAWQRKIPVVLVIWGTDNDAPLKDIYSLVEKEGEKAGYHVLNLVEDVIWPKERFGVSMTNGHPNPKAHNIAADAIYHFLKEKNLVSH